MRLVARARQAVCVIFTEETNAGRPARRLLGISGITLGEDRVDT